MSLLPSETAQLCRGRTFTRSHSYELLALIDVLVEAGLTISDRGVTQDGDLFCTVSNLKPVKRAAPKTRMNQTIGVEVTVGHAEDVGLEFEQGHVHYYSICEEHGSCLGHVTRRTAESFAAVPWEWCEFCFEEREAMS